MRKISATSLAAALLAVSVPATTHADTPRCVSRHEYDRVVKGMTMTKVHQIFDTAGAATGLGAPNELRYYKTCTGRGMVQVVFSPRDLVVSKDGRFF